MDRCRPSMKILYVISHVSPRVIRFSHILANSGHTLTILNSAQTWLPRDRIGKGLFSLTVPPHRLINYQEVGPPLRLKSGTLRLAASAPAIVRSVMSREPHDVVVGYNPTAYSGLPALFAARRARLPF